MFVSDAAAEPAVADIGFEPGNLWRALLSIPSIAIFVVRLDPDGGFRLIEVNELASTFLTKQWSEAEGLTLQETLVAELRDYAQAKVRLCIETGDPQSYERSVDFPEGRRAWTANLIPVRDDSGRMTHIVGLGRLLPFAMHSRGIDERNRALIEGLSAASPGLIYLYDPAVQRVNFVCGRVENLLGYKPYEIEEMANPLAQLIHPDDLSRVVTHVSKAIASFDQLSVFECRVRQRTGTYRHLAFHNRVLDRNSDGTARRLMGVANDVSDQDQLKDEVRSLTNRLATAQLDERRVIAQELHDSAGQYIVAAELALLGAQQHRPQSARNTVLSGALAEVMTCLKDAEREIRVLSYLMHAPQIGSQSLSSLLQNFTVGFGSRAGLRVDVSIDNKVDSIPSHFAVPLFRICQEALTNVHRHAQASSVNVTLDVLDGSLELVIADDGIGIDPDVLNSRSKLGVGISGMSERISGLGGSLRLTNVNGTTLTARIPLPVSF